MEPHGCQKDNRTVTKKITVSYQKYNRGNLKGKTSKPLLHNTLIGCQKDNRLQKWNHTVIKKVTVHYQNSNHTVVKKITVTLSSIIELLKKSIFKLFKKFFIASQKGQYFSLLNLQSTLQEL